MGVEEHRQVGRQAMVELRRQGDLELLVLADQKQVVVVDHAHQQSPVKPKSSWKVVEIWK